MEERDEYEDEGNKTIREEQLGEFMNITSSSKDEAYNCLLSHGWQLEKAVDDYLSNNNSNTSEDNGQQERQPYRTGGRGSYGKPHYSKPRGGGNYIKNNSNYPAQRGRGGRYPNNNNFNNNRSQGNVNRSQGNNQQFDRNQNSNFNNNRSQGNFNRSQGNNNYNRNQGYNNYNNNRNFQSYRSNDDTLESPESDEQDIGESCMNITSVDQAIAAYDDLVSQSKISVSCYKAPRLDSISVVVIGTVSDNNKIYLFDLMSSDKIKIIEALKRILESDVPKILIDSAFVSYMLNKFLHVVPYQVEDLQIIYHLLLNIDGTIDSDVKSKQPPITLESLIETYQIRSPHFKIDLDLSNRPIEEKDIRQIIATSRAILKCHDVLMKYIQESPYLILNKLTEIRCKKSNFQSLARFTGNPPKNISLYLSFTQNKDGHLGPIYTFEPQEEKSHDPIENSEIKLQVFELIKRLPPALAYAICEKNYLNNQEYEKKGIWSQSDINNLTYKDVPDNLIEVIIDENRKPIARFMNDKERTIDLEEPIEIDEALNALVQYSEDSLDEYSGEAIVKFHLTQDNRYMIENSLHRVSIIKDVFGKFCGLTYRVGRHIRGCIDILKDIITTIGRTSDSGSTKSLLILGSPGVGKTTCLREIARIISTECAKNRVIIVDSSNEIGGSGVVDCIGDARRMPVANRDSQNEVMNEAVKNHHPNVLIIDEISNKSDVGSAKIISQKGVGLVATAHGTNLTSLLNNNELNPLMGGIQKIIYGDREQQRLDKAKKTQVERVGSPTFDYIIELHQNNRFIIYNDVSEAVDASLREDHYILEERWVENGYFRSKHYFNTDLTTNNIMKKSNWFAQLCELSKSQF